MTVQFRLVTKLDLSFRPYGDIDQERSLCIRPGGFDNTIKEFNFMRLSGPRQQQHKKVGIRTPYKIKQLLNVRHKFLQLPHELETISGVLEEGLGDFEIIESEHFGSDDVSYANKPILQSKLKKAPPKPGSKPKPKSKLKPTITTTTPDTPIITQIIPENKPTEPTKKDDKLSTTHTKKSNVYKPSKNASPNAPSSSTSSTSSTTPIKPSGGSLSSRSGGWGGKSGRIKNIDPMQAFVNKLRFRLNQITVDNFSSLSERLISIFDAEVNDSEKLEKLVRLIFEKTVQEHVYGPLYAKLCVVLSSKNKSFEDKKQRTIDFKAILLKVCQAEFERGKREAKVVSGMDKTDIENEKIKQKRILMGTMKFIGHLYLVELLPFQIMTVCLKHLILTVKPTQDDVEAACTLLNTVGKQLDLNCNNLIGNKCDNYKQELMKCYQKLISIANNNNYRNEWIRIRILIQNLLELRKNNWISIRQIEMNKPTQLKKLKKKSNLNEMEMDLDVFDLMNDNMEFNNENINTMEMITGSTIMPFKGHVIAGKHSKTNANNRYSKTKTTNKIVNKKITKTINNNRRIGRENKKIVKRILVETEPDVVVNISTQPIASEENNQNIVIENESGIGVAKIRAIIKTENRPCINGKDLSDDKLNEMMSDYLNNRNGMNRTKFIQLLPNYKLLNRQQFIIEFIRKSMDSGKMERFSDIIPILLDKYIIIINELVSAFIEFFKNITYEDDPLLNKNISRLLAPLIVDNELNFNDVLKWIILDIRKNQSDDMLKYYDGDGMKNYMKNKSDQKITKCLDLLAYLLQELKEACFDDSKYVTKLLTKYKFKIDKYVHKNDINNIHVVKNEWIQKYKLAFAFQ